MSDDGIEHLPRPEVRPVTIVVSGYEAVRSVAIYVGERQVVALSDERDVPGWLGEQMNQRPRCASCKGSVQPGFERDDRLGFNGLCEKCIVSNAETCRQQNGRLPNGGEFYCPECRGIQATTELCRPEANGRRRWRCRRCRGAQVRKADLRRRERA